MLRYFSKRLLLLLPVILFTTIGSFIITTFNSKDVIAARILGSDSDIFIHKKASYENEYRKLGYDQPLFYFNIESAILPDTLYKIAGDELRNHIVFLCYKYYNKAEVMTLINMLKAWESRCLTLGADDTINDIKWMQYYAIADTLLHSNDLSERASDFVKSDPRLLSDSTFSKIFNLTVHLNTHASHLKYLQYVPLFYWHGKACRLHQLFTGLLTGNWGTSYTDNRSVRDRILETLPVTLLLSVTNILLLFMTGVFLGVVLSIKKDTWYGRMIQPVLFLLHGIPNYTIAMWCIVIFCCGGVFCWLPSGGIGDDELTFIQRIPYFILPICCWVLPMLSIVTMHTSAAYSLAMQSEYALAARAKGTSAFGLLKHTLKPALLPVMALAGLIVPAALSGSVLIETLFSIPGMGKMSYEALLNRDVPVVLVVTILSVTLSVLTQLLVDILVYIIDPRIRDNNL